VYCYDLYGNKEVKRLDAPMGLALDRIAWKSVIRMLALYLCIIFLCSLFTFWFATCFYSVYLQSASRKIFVLLIVAQKIQDEYFYKSNNTNYVACYATNIKVWLLRILQMDVSSYENLQRQVICQYPYIYSKIQKKRVASTFFLKKSVLIRLQKWAHMHIWQIYLHAWVSCCLKLKWTSVSTTTPSHHHWPQLAYKMVNYLAAPLPITRHACIMLRVIALLIDAYISLWLSHKCKPIMGLHPKRERGSGWAGHCWCERSSS
jgi:hypothetical protein